MNEFDFVEVKVEIDEFLDPSQLQTKTRKRFVERGCGDGFVNQYYREGYTEELEKELRTLKKKLGGLIQVNKSKSAKIDELKESLKKKSLDLKALSSKTHEKHIIKSHLEKHCSPAQTRKLLNPEFNHQRKYEESDFILAAALKSMSPEAYRMIRRKSILSIPGKTLLNMWLKEHKEYAAIFVGCRKKSDQDEDSDKEDGDGDSEDYTISNSKLTHFLTQQPDKIDVNVRSEVGGSIIQLKKKSFHQCIDYFDGELGSIEDRENPTRLEFALALLRETLFSLDPANKLYPKLQLGAVLLHLATKISNFNAIYNYFKVVEREAGKDNISWAQKHIILGLQEKLIERAEAGVLDYDPQILPDSMKKEDEMIVTDEAGNPILLTYVDITDSMLQVSESQDNNDELGTDGEIRLEGAQKGYGVTGRWGKMGEGLERSAAEGMVQLATEGNIQLTSGKRNREKEINPRLEEKRLKKKLKKDRINKEFGDIGVEFDARIQCAICREKVDSYSDLDSHMFISHQQGQSCAYCGIASKTYESYLSHSKSHCHTCDDCDKQFTGRVDLNKHKDLFHIPAQCPVCLKVCAHRHGLKSHMTQSHKNNDIKEFECSSCKFKSFSRLHMIEHLQSKHKSSDSLDFSEGKRLGELQNSFRPTTERPKTSARKNAGRPEPSSGHSSSSIVTCSLCDRILSDPVSLQEHVRTVHHHQALHQCTRCNFKTLYPHNLKKHLEIHEKKREMTFIHDLSTQPLVVDTSSVVEAADVVLDSVVVDTTTVVVDNPVMSTASVVSTAPRVVVRSSAVGQQFSRDQEEHSRVTESHVAASEVPEAAEVMEVSEAAEWLLNQ